MDELRDTHCQQCDKVLHVVVTADGSILLPVNAGVHPYKGSGGMHVIHVSPSEIFNVYDAVKDRMFCSQDCYFDYIKSGRRLD